MFNDKREKKRYAKHLPNGMVEIRCDQFTIVVKPYDVSMHNDWPDLERPKKTRKKRVSKDDAKRDDESGVGGVGLQSED
jgi:hypothetical protein